MTTVRIGRPGATIVSDSTGSGPPVLLLHAGGERRQVWAPVQDALAAAGYQGIAFDLRGHGASGGVGGDALDVIAGDVGAMIDLLDAAPVVVGASLGGFAALLALADREAAVAGLVLVDVVPDPPPDRTRSWLARTVGPLADHPLVDDILRRGPELRRAAATVSAPVLLLRGERSPLTADDAARLRELVPHAREASIAGAGHLVARDAPRQLGELVVDLLGDPLVRARRIDNHLRRAGADAIAHPGGDLLSHLRRTAATLEQWQAPAWVVDAAHVHAAYGTDGFPEGLAGATRDCLVAVVGAQAEALVERYGSCDRAASYPSFRTPEPVHVHRATGRRTAFTDVQLRAFAELTIANELDVFAHSPELAARHARETMRLFTSWSSIVRDPPRRAVREWCAAHHIDGIHREQ
ncbi:alpha/beta hydrolase [Solihabitans fulvus]|uniref:Alpha/beta hydrolase n=1 Tax=Solihabitans fulvus TaxID=1892852 RepID=A0A5B2X2M0_9PSEU|nr:alpha/beta hydrolase [Solihabitans fulvus]KAA2257537.1 alpha/beta hydrolase [Solihabitans fulvus]